MKFNAESGFYIGKVFHSRFLPEKHSFNYDLFMVWLDLDKVKKFFDEEYVVKGIEVAVHRIIVDGLEVEEEM